MTGCIQKAGACPSCDRYIGPVLACPYCGSDSTGRNFLVVIRVAALFLAVAGAVILVLAARLHTSPVVRVRDIRPTMNFGHVRVRGIIDRAPYPGTSGKPDYISFRMNDGTGVLRVAAYSDTAALLYGRVLELQRGVGIEAEGVLSLKAGRPRVLIVKRPQDIRGLEK